MKKAVNGIVWSALHSDITIAGKEKKTSETVTFYNRIKVGVNTLDHMTRKYSIKSRSRKSRRTIYILDIAVKNAQIIYKSVPSKNISKKYYIQQLANELRSN